MRNLILLFIRNGGGLTFWALEVVCFLMIVQFNDPQSQIYVSSLNNFTGLVDEKMADAGDYLELRAISDSLAAENAELYRQLKLQAGGPAPDTMPDISSPADSGYVYIPARVIKNSVNRTNNYLRLDKGSAHGIEPNMGIVTELGVVGIVVDVTENYALVMSLLHQQCRISAALNEEGYFGSLVWDSDSPREATLLDVPKHAEINKGSEVETSGYSLLFPPKLQIGTVDTFWVSQGSSTYTIRVRLKEDFARIHYVYAVKVPDKDEQKSLEAQLEQ